MMMIQKRRTAGGERNFFTVTGGYNYKDALKGLGLSFNGMSKSWEVAIDDMTELGNLLADVVVDCKLSYDDVEMFFANTPNEIANAITMDKEHENKYNAYFDDLEEKESAVNENNDKGLKEQDIKNRKKTILRVEPTSKENLFPSHKDAGRVDDMIKNFPYFAKGEGLGAGFFESIEEIRKTYADRPGASKIDGCGEFELWISK